MIDECFVEDQAGLGSARLGYRPWIPGPRRCKSRCWVAIGSPPVCLEWSAGRVLAAGPSEDEIADVLLAIAPVAGLGRPVCAAPDVATALGYDIAAAFGGTG